MSHIHIGLAIALLYIAGLILAWSLCVVAKRADNMMWPDMPDLEGNDIFLETYGPPTGNETKEVKQ